MTRRPTRQPAALLEHLHQGHEHVPLILGSNQRVQRMRGADGIPKGEVGEIAEARGLMYLAVKPQVISIHIVKERRHLECPEERRVEHRLPLIRAPLDSDRTEPLFPGSLRLGHDLVEILVPGFRLQVVPGVFKAHVGDR